MKRLPFVFDHACDVQVKHVPAFIQPIPDLKNYSSLPMIGVKGGALHGWSFFDQDIVIANARHQETMGSQLGSALLCRLNQLLRIFQMGRALSMQITASNEELANALRSSMLAMENGMFRLR